MLRFWLFIDMRISGRIGHHLYIGKSLCLLSPCHQEYKGQKERRLHLSDYAKRLSKYTKYIFFTNNSNARPMRCFSGRTLVSRVVYPLDLRRAFAILDDPTFPLLPIAAREQRSPTLHLVQRLAPDLDGHARGDGVQVVVAVRDTNEPRDVEPHRTQYTTELAILPLRARDAEPGVGPPAPAATAGRGRSVGRRCFTTVLSHTSTTTTW